MAAAASETGRIQAQGAQGEGCENSRPPRGDSQEGSEHGGQTDGQDGQSGSKGGEVRGHQAISEADG